MTSDPQKNQAQLRRALGLFDATAISVGAIIGAGIFVVIGMVAGLAGPAVIVTIIVAGVIASFSALSFAQLSAHMPKEGGGYQFAYRMVSPYAGFLAGWMWILSNLFVAAAVSLGFAHYLVALVPSLPVNAVAVALCLLFTLLNYVGVRQSAMVNNIMVVSKILILILFAALGSLFINFKNFSPLAPNGPLGVLEGTSLIFFAYFGYARITILAEEVKDASRTIPRAIILALALSTVLYALIGFVAVGLVGSNSLAQSTSPLADAISVTGNSVAVFVVSLGAMIATASVLLMAIMGVSRMAFAMARNQQLPAFLSRIHSQSQTPYYAVWITGALSTLLVFGGFARVVAVSTFSLLFHHALVNLSASRLRAAHRHYLRFVAYVGLIFCLVMMVFLSTDAWFVGLLGLAIGTVYYWLRRRMGADS